MIDHRIRPVAAGLVVLLLFTWMVYSPVLDADFVNFDDNEYVTENPHIPGGLSESSVRWALTSTETGAYWMPVVWISYLLDHELYGMDPRGFHRTNLLFHLLNIVLLFLFLRSATASAPLSFGVAALFALHPMHVESVAWISQRKDMLSTFFWLLALWAYVRYARTGHKGPYIAAAAAMGLSLMSKGTAVSLPILMLLLDLWPLNRMRCAWNNVSSFIASWRIAEKLPFFLIALAFAFITYVTQKAGGAMRPDIYTLDVRILNAVTAYGLYIVKTVWPTGLAAHYAHPGADIQLWPAALSALFLIAVTGLAWKKRADHPWLLVGWGWYLVTLLPMIGLVQVGGQAMADRFTYVPHTGLFIIFVWGAVHARALRLPWLQPRLRRALGVAVLGGVLLLMGLLSRVQVGYWQDTETLFQRVLAVNPDDAYAHYNLGVEYMERGEWDRASRHFKQAATFNPSDYEAKLNLGLVYMRQQDYASAALVFENLVQDYPALTRALAALGQAMIHLNRHDDAAAYLSRAVALEPDNVGYRGNLAMALVRAGRHVAAASHLEFALRHAPDHPGLLYHHGVVQAARGRHDEALAAFHAALEAGWNDPLVFRDMGTVYAIQQDHSRAVRYFSIAIEHNPTDHVSMNNLAWLLATHPDGTMADRKQAVHMAERAARVTGYAQIPVLKTLATAYAGAHEYEKATETVERALALLSETDTDALREELEQMRKSYAR